MKSNTMRAIPALVMANAMMAMAMMAVAYGSIGAQELEREFIDPAGVFTQVVTVADHGVKTIYVSGQVGQGADLAAHVDTAFHDAARWAHVKHGPQSGGLGWAPPEPGFHSNHW